MKRRTMPESPLGELSIADEVGAYRYLPGPRCAVCALPQDQLEAINDALKSHPGKIKALAVVVARRGVKVTSHSLGNHYRESHHVRGDHGKA